MHTFVLYRFLFTLLSAIDFCAHFCPLQIFFHTFVCYRLRILNPPPLFLGSPVLLMYKYDTSKIFYFTNFLLHLAHYVSTAFFMIYRIVYLDSSTWEWNLEVYIYIYNKNVNENLKNKNSYFLHWNCDWKSCFVVFFLERNEWKNLQFNFSSQNLSIKHNFFKWDGKETKILHLLFHRIWKRKKEWWWEVSHFIFSE